MRTLYQASIAAAIAPEAAMTGCGCEGGVMKLAITGKLQAGEKAPQVLRGSYDDMIRRAAEIGYDAVELHIHDSGQLDRDALRKLFEVNRITLSSIGTGSAYSEDRLSLSSSDPDCRRSAVRRILDHIVTARDYGAVVIIGLIKGMIRDCGSRKDFEDLLGQSLDELVEAAAASEVILVFEIINRYESDCLNTIADGLALLAHYDTPYLQLHIDTFHMNIEEPDIGASIRAAKGKIAHCHVADSDRWYAGHGHYDFPATIAALRDIGYERALSVESLMYPNPDVSAVRSLAALKRYLQTK
jgi:5-keto-L-gluconate epimerase